MNFVQSRATQAVLEPGTRLLLVENPVEDVTTPDVDGLAAVGGCSLLAQVGQGVGQDEEVAANNGQRGVTGFGQPEDVRRNETGSQWMKGVAKDVTQQVA